MGERELPGRGPGPDAGTGPSGPLTDAVADRDFEQWAAWVDREIAAGRDPLPPEKVYGAQGITVSIGEPSDIDPGLLAAISIPDGPGPGSQFTQDAAADVLPPGPVLAALTEAAVTDVTQLSDGQLIGVLHAVRRQENREAWKKALVIAEFARRKAAEFTAAGERGVPVYCRPGQFPGEELTMELLVGPVQASHAIDDATDLATRLPATLAGMAAGLIDEARAGVIAFHTRSLTLTDAAFADEVLAGIAPVVRLEQLARKAAALDMRLAPEAVKARREHARRTRQRVEVRREDSGNASVAGREMDPGDVLASKANIHALALRLRRAGMPGTLDQLRLLVFADLTAGRNPLDRLTAQGAGSGAASPAGPGPAPAALGPDRDTPGDSPDSRDSSGQAVSGEAVPDGDGRSGNGKAPGDSGVPGDARPAGTHPGDRPGSLDYPDEDLSDDPVDGLVPQDNRPLVPVPATINLLVPAGTLLGWDTTPAEAGGWGLLDADENRKIVMAASRHSVTRWCVTVLGRDGTALAHGCSPGQHSWTPPGAASNDGYLDTTGPPRPGAPNEPDAPATPDTHPPRPGAPGTHREHRAGGVPRTPTPTQVAELAEFLRSLNVTFTPVARGNCDHAAAEPQYTPSRKLAHLVRARTATCDAPGCMAQAVHADLDHTTPYPEGPTDQCNLGPKCRRHHKVKQAPDWVVEQSEPGVMRWTLPSGRTHTTRATVYGGAMGGDDLTP